MRLPAIKAKIGNNIFYITTLSFQQVSEKVGRIENEVYNSPALSDLLQRGLTENFKSIKDYILNQEDRFFNSIVLAVYNEYPDWREIEFEYDDMETYVMGILEFSEDHKIFPIDGQHRVEGIKEALKENPDLADECIGAIFVGHVNTRTGKINTRRLFTTLNRYAKPVKLNDIIALDEDDIVAIATRDLVENHGLFCGTRVFFTENKSIPVSNKDALTSIITLYQTNIELYLHYHKAKNSTNLRGKRLTEKLKYRPEENEILEFKEFLASFWWDFANSVSSVRDYLGRKTNPASSFRNPEIGGNLIFRPVSFKPLIQAIIKIKEFEKNSFMSIMKRLNTLNLNISSGPWVKVLWEPVQRKMIMGNQNLVYLILTSLLNRNALSVKERNSLQSSYLSKTGENFEIHE